MGTTVCRVFVERKNGFENEAGRLFSELKDFLGIQGLEKVRYLNRYDVDGLAPETVRDAAVRIFSDPHTDTLSFETFETSPDETVLPVEYVPGQYDQRADSAAQCVALLGGAEHTVVRTARVYVLKGSLSEADIGKIRAYLINPVDSRLASESKPASLSMHSPEPPDIPVLDGFRRYDDSRLADFLKEKSLAMDFADIRFLQAYFEKEGRDPTETELRVLDTYWSDHCRHTTFNTHLRGITIQDGTYKDAFEEALRLYTGARAELYAGKDKPVSLMDMAVIGAKILKKRGLLNDVEESAEINACSVFVTVTLVDGEGRKAGEEPWLLMFKNETHNHPTEIEPFGGAATCIGGAIRDPLSGRAWVYQAMRVTGAADPTASVASTIPGKLPQIKLTREAAAGFSAYGNQIGLTTGQVVEYYHPGFAAKRMELGAVIAAAPVSAVKREEPEPGDVVVLVGGGTGRDGIGGATGSSKAHTERSVSTAGAEVQKGNAVEERKLQRLFRNEAVARMIRRCNDFGAGGVAVAVGELAPGLDIDLDAVPKKYEGLNGTELAVSESQERMAVVVRAEDCAAFLAAAAGENLNGAVIARVTDTGRLVMRWRGKTVVDIDRAFLDTAGADREEEALILQPEGAWHYAGEPESGGARNARRAGGLPQPEECTRRLKDRWLSVLADLSVAGQRGLSERFDGSIGSASVLFPFGGRFQSTPEVGMAARIPVGLGKETSTVSLMSHGYDPRAFEWSPFHGAQMAVLESLAKILALGGDPFSARLTFQEYFERMGSPETWGKPAAALLGALQAQVAVGVPSIGGKDSMSGSFEHMHVPPTLVSFAVAVCDERRVRSGAFASPGSKIALVYTPWKKDASPDWDAFRENAAFVNRIASPASGRSPIRSAYTVGAGGIAAAVTKAAFGNKVGANLDAAALQSVELPEIFSVRNQSGSSAADDLPLAAALFAPLYGSVLLELDADSAGEESSPALSEVAAARNVFIIGETSREPFVTVASCALSLEEARQKWEEPLAKVFPPVSGCIPGMSIPDWASAVFTRKTADERCGRSAGKASVSSARHPTLSGNAKPLVALPVFPGTNCEYDMARAFALAGAETRFVLIRNRTKRDLDESLEELRANIGAANILAFSGGFSAGDEPDGSAKFIASVIREERIAEAIMELFRDRGGLILGICNGFQALIKTGLVPFGEIIPPDRIAESPTLTFNTIGRHVSRFVRTKIVSDLSPWTHGAQDRSDSREAEASERCGALSPGSVHMIPVSHGEGRLIVSEACARTLFASGQVFSQYVDASGNPSMSEPDNPNGSFYAVEGLTDATGRILGKMGHSERAMDVRRRDASGCGHSLFKNIPGDVCQNIFAAGVGFFK